MSRCEKSAQTWEARIKELDERLRPIAKRPVDITRAGWFQNLGKGAPPLDEAGVREIAQVLLDELIEAYARGSAETRATIRKLFVEHTSFAWAATLSNVPASVEGFRKRLILFSIQDQGRDSRDALLTLQAICAEAKAARIDLAPLLTEVASMSSSINRFGMGSTCQMLLKHRG